VSFETERQLRREPVLREIVDVILSFPVKSCVYIYRNILGNSNAVICILHCVKTALQKRRFYCSCSLTDTSWNVLKSRYADIDTDYRAAFYHLHKTKVLSGRLRRWTKIQSGNTRRWLMTQIKMILEMTPLVLLICHYVSFHNSEVRGWNLIEFCKSVLQRWGKAEELIVLLLPLPWPELNLFSSRRSVMSYLRSKYECFNFLYIF